MALYFFFLVGLLASVISIESTITIDTKLGEIEGLKNDRMSTFLNIPYALPPVGKYRWKPTRKLPCGYQLTQDGSPYNATVFGNACIQTNLTAALMAPNHTLSEDCLYLRIDTPYNFNTDNKHNKLKNVMFWIHGGALTIGTGGVFDGKMLGNYKDIVIVSINYRLGIHGFLLDPENDESKFGTGGANNILDMITALKWTKKHISSFGGNPNEITIAGESAGGLAVCGLILSPLARGLFKRSIQMSGTCIDSAGRFSSKEESWEAGKKAKEVMNITTFEELRNMDLGLMANLYTRTTEPVVPSIDGYVFPDTTMNLLKSGVINGESTMIGTIIRESLTEKPFNLGVSPKNEKELNAFYSKYLYDTQVELLKKYYPFDKVKNKIYNYGKSEWDNNTATLIHTQLITDCWVRCGSLWESDILANHKLLKNSFPVYFYQYGYINEPYDQVSHGYDVIGLFGNDIEWGPKYSPEFTKITQDFFGDYVNGKPPKKDNIDASIQNGYYAEIFDKIHIRQNTKLDAMRERCNVWKLFGPNIYKTPLCIGFDMKESNMLDDWLDEAGKMNQNDSQNDTHLNKKEDL